MKATCRDALPLDMESGIAQLKKLLGKSIREINVRGRQQVTKLSERLLNSNAGEMSDRGLLREINPVSRNGNGLGSAKLILERIRSSASRSFFSSLTHRSEIAAIVNTRFPRERDALIEQAENATRGRFDLPGFTDLSFGDPIDWHLDPTTGKSTSRVHWSKINYLDCEVAGDKKVTWELNRHSHFVTLGQAYWITNDERFTEAFVSQASAWMDANPPKLGINWASSLELSFRVIAWLWALHLFAESDRLSARFVSRFVKYLIAQGRHIESYLSHYFSPNTHLTGEALGLFYLGTALPELARANRWRDLGLRILLAELPRHIRRDGTYFEQSSYYHRYTVDFYAHVVGLARSSGAKLPAEVEERLSLALDHLMFITRPDGATPLYGDDDGGRLLRVNMRGHDDFRDTLAVGSALFGRGDWKFVAGEAPIELLWLLGPEGLERYEALEAREPRDTSRAFREGGYFVMRDGWSRESSYALVDCGPHGSLNNGHSHADALAFEYAAEGTTWLVDPGTFTYTGDAKLRDQFRTSEAHNTVTIDDEPQSVPGGPFAWETVAQSKVNEFIANDRFDYFEGWHDGYEQLEDPVTHTRSMLFLKPSGRSELPAYVVVRDQFTARELHRYASRYHFAAGCSASASGNKAKASNLDGRELSISAFGQSEPRARIEESWVSRCYGKREQAPVSVFECEAAGAQDFVTIIGPFETNRTRIESHPQAPDRRSYGAYSVSAGDSTDVVLMGGAAGELAAGHLVASGSLALARFNGNGFESGCLIRGGKFEVEGCFAFVSPATLASCTLKSRGGHIEITIHHARRFDLSFINPPTRIVVNKSSFNVMPASRGVSFALERSGWKVTGEV